jgi:hypothetical protein
MLSTIEGRIQRLMVASAPVSEMLAAAPTADFDPVWRRGYVTGGIFLRMIMAGLGLTWLDCKSHHRYWLMMMNSRWTVLAKLSS